MNPYSESPKMGGQCSIECKISGQSFLKTIVCSLFYESHSMASVYATEAAGVKYIAFCDKDKPSEYISCYHCTGARCEVVPLAYLFTANDVASK